jgi:hypothetical protein
MRLLCCAIVMLMGGACAWGQNVTVNKAAPAVETKVYDPRNPPKEMPKLNPPEVAVADSQLQIASNFTSIVEQQGQRNGSASATVRVRGASLQLTLKIVIWLPPNVDAKTRAHELAHQRISERHYRDAEKVAKRLGEGYLGKTFTAEANTAAAAAEKAQQQAMAALSKENMAAVYTPLSRAQAIFDRITDHGRNGVSEDGAIERAIEEAAKEP